MHILMIAAENDALPGGKVGGLGDVIRDLPAALARHKQQVSVVTPGYGALAPANRINASRDIVVEFCGRSETVTLLEVTPRHPVANTTHYVLEHWLFSAGGAGNIYTMDHYGPFATDAHKFALFCLAVSQAVITHEFGNVDVLHCHDWHTAPLLILRKFAKQFSALQSLHAVYSIHNLSMQGVRPLRGDESSLESWFPFLNYDHELIADRYNADCVNFMRAGINLADKVHTVSPTYAKEILSPSHWEQGQVGGEGLEKDLQKAAARGALLGILNGCEHANEDTTPPDKKTVIHLAEQAIDTWAKHQASHSTSLSASYYFALRHVLDWQKKRRATHPVLVSIGRLTAQKLLLLKHPYQFSSVLEALLDKIGNGLFILLGNGDADYDKFFTKVMSGRSNFLYLSGFSQPLADALYQFGDVFVMPSIYEPCGISQMLAMRGGTPCLASEVGGLKDTVLPGVNGFTFAGVTLDEKAENFMLALDETLACFAQPAEWQKRVAGALVSDFSWDASVQAYITELYSS